MLALFTCLAGVFSLLVISELLGREKYMKGDPQRQFVHIAVGSFVAFWPWIISWAAISWIGVAMLAVVLLNQRVRLIDLHSKIRRFTYGEIFYALAIVVLPLLTKDKIFFALAILIMAIGDGLANIIGQKYGKAWHYRVFDNSKTIIGSMAIWLSTVFILGFGLPFAQDIIGFSHYLPLLLILPPIVTLIENAGFFGVDNLAIPLVVLLVLNLAK